jgi:PAS domain-containing protein
MSQFDTIPLPYLLERQAIAALLTEFESLMPGVALALLESSGYPFVGTGEWPFVDLTQLIPHASGQAGYTAETAEFTLRPLVIEDQLVGALASRGPASPVVLRCLQHCLTLLLTQAWEKRVAAGESLARYREANLLYNIGETINTCLNPEEIPLRVLLEANRVIRAKVGLVLLPWDDDSALTVRASFGAANYGKALAQLAQPAIDQVWHSHQPLNQANNGSTPIGPFLCVPLKTRHHILGVVVLGRLEIEPAYTAIDEKLLLTLATQAAIALENAHHFADLTRQRDSLTAQKAYMDQVWASLPDGVITLDPQDRIVALNQTAAHILAVEAKTLIAQSYLEGLPEVSLEIVPLVDAIKQGHTSKIKYEATFQIAQRGWLTLNLQITPLHTETSSPPGVIILLDLLSESQPYGQPASSRLLKST